MLQIMMLHGNATDDWIQTSRATVPAAGVSLQGRTVAVCNVSWKERVAGSSAASVIYTLTGHTSVGSGQLWPFASCSVVFIYHRLGSVPPQAVYIYISRWAAFAK